MKILLLPPKYEIIMVPSNHSIFQYCDSNIGLLSIAPCKVITLNPFWYQFFASFLMVSFLKLSLFQTAYSILVLYASNYRDSCRLFSLLKAIAKRLPLLFTNASKSVKERQLFLSQWLKER